MPQPFRLRKIGDAKDLTPEYKEWICKCIAEGQFDKALVIKTTEIHPKTLNKWLRGEGLGKSGRKPMASPEVEKNILEALTDKPVCIRPDEFVDVVVDAINKAAGDGPHILGEGPSPATLKRIKKKMGIANKTAEVQTKARIVATAEIRNQVSWAAVFKYITERKKVSYYIH